MLKYGDTAATKSTTPLKSTTKIQILTDKNDNTKSSNSPASSKGNYCAECGKKCHTLTRTKTGMPVCKDCHSRFTKTKVKQLKTRRSTEGDQQLDSSLLSTKPNGQTTANGGSLLEGTYDEEANAASFAEALAEWRNSGSQNKVSDGTSASGNSASCQTMTGEQRTSVIPEFHSSGSVTYLERLMIRRNRYDPKFLKNSVAVQKCSSMPTSMNPSVQDTVDIEAPSPYNVFYEGPPEQWNSLNNQEAHPNTPLLNTDLTESHTSTTSTIKPLAMKTAIREAWASKEDNANLSHFFLSGVDNKNKTTPISECQDKEKLHNIILGQTTGTWKPEQSIVGNYSSLKTQDEESDSDDSDNALDLTNCESDKEEWEMDDRITLECLERELQASQLGNNPEQEHQEIINHDSDFEEIEREIQKDEQ